MRKKLIGLLIGTLLFPCMLASAQGGPPARVYVVLWFDTEDYLLPSDDDATLRLAQFLSGEGIRATFKFVGEKARTLERRKRVDVIEAMKKHEIGYHSNFHSVHPTPAMYLSNLGWDEGVAEFERREGPGREDVRRIFGVVPTCYGQPGSSWGPQSYGALRTWNMIYLDAGSHVNLEGKPCYYGGVLNLYKLQHTLRTNLGGEQDLKEAEDRFVASYKAILAEGGGLVSVYYHPCEFVHKQFWDGVNFAKGANPPREEWKLPPTKTPEETKLAYATFESYIRFIKRFPEVRFITASEAAELYPDRAQGRRYSTAEVTAIAESVGEDLTFQSLADHTLSAAEVFQILNRYLASQVKGNKPEGVYLDKAPLGPTGKVMAQAETVATDASQFGRTCLDVDEFLRRHERLPSAVWLGSEGVTPEAYLVALAKVVREVSKGQPIPKKIEVKPARLASAQYVSADDPKLWGWVIFPPNFRAPDMMELGKKQAWTLKPALLTGGRE